MLASNNVFVTELSDDNSLGRGRYNLVNAVPSFDGMEQALRSAFNAATSRSTREPSQQIDRSRSARVTSARFSDTFGLTILEGIGPTDYKEVVGGANEWYILSARLSGDTLESVRNEHYRLGACSCYLVRYHRGMSHILRSVSQLPLIEACVAFRPSVLADRIGCATGELEELLEYDGCGSGPGFSSLEMSPDIEAVVHELRSVNPTEPTFCLFAEAKSLELISLYFRRLLKSSARRADGRSHVSSRPWSMSLIRRYLEINYCRRCSIDELSEMAGFSRKGLTTTFKRKFGVSIQQYHQAVRMEIACAMLRNKSCGVSWLAELLGYEHPANFAKAFSRYSGKSPTAYISACTRRLAKPRS